MCSSAAAVLPPGLCGSTLRGLRSPAPAMINRQGRAFGRCCVRIALRQTVWRASIAVTRSAVPRRRSGIARLYGPMK